MTRITSENGQIIVVITNNIALICFHKRYFLEPGIETMPFGHFCLNQNREDTDFPIDAADDRVNLLNQFCKSDDCENSESKSAFTQLSRVGQKNSDERKCFNSPPTDSFGKKISPLKYP